MSPEQRLDAIRALCKGRIRYNQDEQAALYALAEEDRPIDYWEAIEVLADWAHVYFEVLALTYDASSEGERD